ncbi:zincin [Polychaeton citri CBS 116435]|uniref:Disintegrin and metalloproteinase domain-containing protein B n=1 Tax=Polychaeton citri CBS 116435 TaxID=1314669 RepID=A0A9P4QFR9_9PEZI|nr:zincin [Polychaeton citri CBS 116435]
MRSIPFLFLSLAASLFSPYSVVDARSSPRNPIGAVSTAQNATIHTNKGRISATSKFDLTFTLRDDLYVKLVLEPNHDILAGDSYVNTLGADGEIREAKKIDRHSKKVYKGAAWVQRPGVGQHKWQRSGWARVHVTRDGLKPLFEGAFAVQRDHHHVQTSYNYLRTRHLLDPEIELGPEEDEYLVVWRDSDILSKSKLAHQDLKRGVAGQELGCRSDNLKFNTQDDHPVFRAMMKRSDSYFGAMDFSNIFKRQIDSTTGGNSGGFNLVQSIGDSTGCPSTKKVALVGVATDCTYTADFNSSETAQDNVVTQMNTASGVWEDTFKISLGLANLTASEAECPGTPRDNAQWNQACSDSVTIENRLNLFSAWRGQQADTNSHWTLLSTCNTGSAVGLAWLGQACVGTAYTTGSSQTGNGQADTSGQETVTGANVVIRTRGAEEWQIIAHETGHTYGAVHDCDSQTCQDANFVSAQKCCQLSASTCDAGSRYIMNPSTDEGIEQFSPCSIGNICGAIGRNSINTSCLKDNNEISTFSEPVCGNGIVEPGEQCDCGGDASCQNDPCCNGSTCQYRDGAECDDSNDDCCRNCQLASQGTVCRASTGTCDPQEVCTGNSSSCPVDVTSPDGQGCGNGLQCAAGQCTSRDQQCKSVMGSYTQGNDTYACDSSGCTISCASPEFGYGVCYGLQQNFLDGTQCGGGGRCSNGQCRGSSVGGQVRSWIDDHKAIVIGICSAVGGLLLLAILGCLIRCCRRRRTAPRQKVPPPPPGGWQGWGNRGAPPMQQQQQQSYHPQHPTQGWFPQHQGAGRPPPPPPPAYGGASRSVRYA